METSLSELEAKIEKMEKELAELKVEHLKLKAKEKREDAPSLIEVAGPEWFCGSDVIKKGFAKFMKEAGIPIVEPIGIKKLQELMAQSNLEKNELSRAIIEMREE